MFETHQTTSCELFKLARASRIHQVLQQFCGEFAPHIQTQVNYCRYIVVKFFLKRQVTEQQVSVPMHNKSKYSVEGRSACHAKDAQVA